MPAGDALPPEQEPPNQPIESNREPDDSEVLTLVDLFDRIDRAAFHRALDHRDNHYRPPAKP